MCGIDIEHGFLMRRRSVCRIVPLSALQRPDRTSSCASREKKLLRQPAQQEYPRSLSTLSDV
jgi:hypothetical protein